MLLQVFSSLPHTSTHKPNGQNGRLHVPCLTSLGVETSSEQPARAAYLPYPSLHYFSGETARSEGRSQGRRRRPRPQLCLPSPPRPATAVVGRFPGGIWQSGGVGRTDGYLLQTNRERTEEGRNPLCHSEGQRRFSINPLHALAAGGPRRAVVGGEEPGPALAQAWRRRYVVWRIQRKHCKLPAVGGG